jgi:DNA replication protein DnaC
LVSWLFFLTDLFSKSILLIDLFKLDIIKLIELFSDFVDYKDDDCINEIEKIFAQLNLGHFPDCSSFAILGAAGVGKSWLTSEIVKLAVSMHLKCYLSTPTHKAIKILSKQK